jgi:hypothetical protein
MQISYYGIIQYQDRLSMVGSFSPFPGDLATNADEPRTAGNHVCGLGDSVPLGS